MKSNQNNELDWQSTLDNIITIASNGNTEYAANRLLALIADSTCECSTAQLNDFIKRCNDLNLCINLTNTSKYPDWIYDAIALHKDLINPR